MGTVMMHAAVSVDGFIADENDQVGPLFDYYGNGDAEIIEGGEIKVSQVSAAMDVVPVVFGSGRRYFGSAGGLHLLEDPHTVIQGDRVLHLGYRPRR